MIDRQHDLERRLANLENKLQMLLVPSQQSEQTTETPTATAMMKHAVGQTPHVPLQQSYGFWSRPLQGCLHTIMNFGGKLNRPVSVAQNDERYRPTDLNPGDVTMRDNTSQRIWLEAGTTIAMNANQQVTINAPTQVTITTPLVTMNSQNVHITGNLAVDGSMVVLGNNGTGGIATFHGPVKIINGGLTSAADVTAGSVSLEGHHHTDPQGGTTGPAV